MTIIDLSNRLFAEKLSENIFINREQKLKHPVHVVYGGADRFTAETPKKFGKLALNSLETYAPNFVEFANAMWLKGCDTLPKYVDVIADLEFQLIDKNEQLKRENYNAWFAWTVYNRVIEKLKSEPVEDFRIDFEDGYGIRSDDEEDNHALLASNELAHLIGRCDSETERPRETAPSSRTLSVSQSLPFCGFRIKSFQPETYKRSVRTLDLFLTNLLHKTGGLLPENFAVTLPKITKIAEVDVLCQLLKTFETINSLPVNSIKIEIMIETPESIFIMKDLVAAAKGRCVSAHFGAYDYTASFGITAVHQHLRHEACNFARQMMQISLSPLNIRLSDSVTTEMPVPIHRGEGLSTQQLIENKQTVQKAWRLHFNNITNSQINGFYQSWDLHPAQLVARYAAVYSFFLESFESQSIRLKGFMNKATKAAMSGNQFDDAASAQGLINYFLRGMYCGALTENEVLESTTLTFDELKSESFVKIMENR